MLLAVFCFFIFWWASVDGLSEKGSTLCLEKVENSFRNQNLDTIDLSETITCFEWDKILITGSRRAVDEDNELDYTVVGHIYNKKEASSYNDWLDGDRHWWYIFFFKKNEANPSNAFIIANTVFVYDDTLSEWSKSNSKFLISDGDANGRFRKLSGIFNE